jgi:cobaltochelatase CobS
MDQTNPTWVTRPAKDLFGGVLQANTPLNGFDRPWELSHIRSPRPCAGYVWDVDKLKWMIAFFLSGNTAARFIGHTGTGKTECVAEFHAQLNLPLFCITANPRMEAFQLIGRYLPVAGGGVEWRDGPVLAAARYGFSVVVEEYNVLDPGEATGLNSFLEGRPYTVPETGETVVPKQGFRVFATVNPKSFGYAGRNQQDIANDDRFVNQLFCYPDADVERPLVETFLKSALRQSDDEAANIATLVVKSGNMIRDAFMGENDSADALPFTMSRRGVMEWAKWTVLSKSLAPSGTDPLFHALDTVVGYSLDREGREALRVIVEGATGRTRTVPKAQGT